MRGKRARRLSRVGGVMRRVVLVAEERVSRYDCLEPPPSIAAVSL
jgi:hypothetical protein